LQLVEPLEMPIRPPPLALVFWRRSVLLRIVLDLYYENILADLDEEIGVEQPPAVVLALL
jgi:hypothetical protein